jgi:multidrug efflux pump subunit AcrA (membrane-fusion protein)
LAPPPLPAPQPVAPPPAEIQPSQTQAELPAAAVDTRKETEAVVARLQAELSAAVDAKAQAELARTRAEKAAQEAKSDAEVARKKLDVARNDTAAASNEIDRLRASGGQPVSYAKITLIWVSITGALLFFVWAFSKILASYRRMAKARKVHVGEVMDPPPAGWQAPTEAKLDEDDLVKRMAHTLGVEDPAVPLSEEEALMYERRRRYVANDHSEPQSVASDDAVQVIHLPDRSSPVPSGHDHDTSKSIVPATGNGQEVEPPQTLQATQAK